MINLRDPTAFRLSSGLIHGAMNGFGPAKPMMYTREAICFNVSSARFPLCDRNTWVVTGHGKEGRCQVSFLQFEFPSTAISGRSHDRAHGAHKTADTLRTTLP